MTASAVSTRGSFSFWKKRTCASARERKAPGSSSFPDRGSFIFREKPCRNPGSAAGSNIPSPSINSSGSTTREATTARLSWSAPRPSAACWPTIRPPAGSTSVRLLTTACCSGDHGRRSSVVLHPAFFWAVPLVWRLNCRLVRQRHSAWTTREPCRDPNAAAADGPIIIDTGSPLGDLQRFTLHSPLGGWLILICGRPR